MSPPKITPLGIAVLWLGIALMVIGGARYSGVTLLLGLLCFAGLISARVLSRKNLSGLAFRRDMPKTAFAGELFESRVFVQCASNEDRKVDGRDIRFRDKLLHTVSNSQLIETLPKKGETMLSVRSRLPRRGKHARSRFDLKSSWPLGLFTVRELSEYPPRSEDDPDEITIFPRPLMPALLLQQLEKFQAEALAKNSFELENAGDFRGVRPYRPGDPMKSIHWPATARADEIVVRDWDPPRPKPQRFGLILHSLMKPGELVQPERFEVAVRIATGLILYCRDNQIPLWISLDLNDSEWIKIPDETGITTALLDLALIKPRPLKRAAELKKRVKEFEPCERLFVISDSPVANWRNRLTGLHPSLIVADPDSVASTKNRRVRIAKVPTAKQHC